MECYRGQKAQPVIEISHNAFKIMLPNTNFHREVRLEDDGLSDTERKVMDYLSGRDSASRREAVGCVVSCKI